MRRVVLAVLVLGVGIGVPAAPMLGSPPATSASVTIRHQVRGCHSWSVNGGAFAASRSLRIARGGSITFTNDDVMPHALVEVSGPRVRMQNRSSMPMGMGGWGSVPGVMNHMGAATTVYFTRAGRYTFRTKTGRDYMPGFRTVGEDNRLTLTVRVR